MGFTEGITPGGNIHPEGKPRPSQPIDTGATSVKRRTTSLKTIFKRIFDENPIPTAATPQSLAVQDQGRELITQTEITDRIAPLEKSENLNLKALPEFYEALMSGTFVPNPPAAMVYEALTRIPATYTGDLPEWPVVSQHKGKNQLIGLRDSVDRVVQTTRNRANESGVTLLILTTEPGGGKSALMEIIEEEVSGNYKRYIVEDCPVQDSALLVLENSQKEELRRKGIVIPDGQPCRHCNQRIEREGRENMKIRESTLGNGMGIFWLRQMLSVSDGKPNTEYLLEAVTKANGGILFIDELYKQKQIVDALEDLVAQGRFGTKEGDIFPQLLVVGALTAEKYKKLASEHKTFVSKATKVIKFYWNLGMSDERNITHKFINMFNMYGKDMQQQLIGALSHFMVEGRLEDDPANWTRSQVGKNPITREVKMLVHDGRSPQWLTTEEIQNIRDIPQSDKVSDGRIGLNPRLGRNFLEDVLKSHPEAKTVHPLEFFRQLSEFIEAIPVDDLPSGTIPTKDSLQKDIEALRLYYLQWAKESILEAIVEEHIPLWNRRFDHYYAESGRLIEIQDSISEEARIKIETETQGHVPKDDDLQITLPIDVTLVHDIENVAFTYLTGKTSIPSDADRMKIRIDLSKEITDLNGYEGKEKPVSGRKIDIQRTPKKVDKPSDYRDRETPTIKAISQTIIALIIQEKEERARDLSTVEVGKLPSLTPETILKSILKIPEMRTEEEQLQIERVAQVLCTDNRYGFNHEFVYDVWSHIAAQSTWDQLEAELKKETDEGKKGPHNKLNPKSI